MKCREIPLQDWEVLLRQREAVSEADESRLQEIHAVPIVYVSERFLGTVPCFKTKTNTNSMARKKRKSDALTNAEGRAEGLATIDPKLNLGEDLTLKSYQDKIDETQATLTEYNGLLAGADVALVKLEQQERELRDLSERMLEGVSSRFGKNSEQYQKAGGTRKDQIDHSGGRAKVAKLDKAA